MPEITLEKKKTALLIADFYADMMTTMPHAVDRKIPMLIGTSGTVVEDSDVYGAQQHCPLGDGCGDADLV